MFGVRRRCGGRWGLVGVGAFGPGCWSGVMERHLDVIECIDDGVAVRWQAVLVVYEAE